MSRMATGRSCCRLEMWLKLFGKYGFSLVALASSLRSSPTPVN